MGQFVVRRPLKVLGWLATAVMALAVLGMFVTTNAPPKPEDGKGIKGWVMKQIMKRAGARVPSANRITLLRDSGGLV